MDEPANTFTFTEEEMRLYSEFRTRVNVAESKIELWGSTERGALADYKYLRSIPLKQS